MRMTHRAYIVKALTMSGLKFMCSAEVSASYGHTSLVQELKIVVGVCLCANFANDDSSA